MRYLTVGLCCLFLATCKSSTPSAESSGSALQRAPGFPELERQDQYYGVYLQGHKVGWMRSQLTPGEQVKELLALEARVSGLGNVSMINLREERVYDGTSGDLVRLSFEQRAATGTMKVEGLVKKDKLELQVTAGAQTTTQVVPASDTLQSRLATQRLAKDAKVGASVTVSQFDASVLKQMTITHNVVGVEKRNLAGVVAETVRVESSYKDMGVTEASWIDRQGKILESRVGGFFVARLEPADVAKRIDYSQDILVSAVVKSSVDLSDVGARKDLELVFDGFGAFVPPSSDRQEVKKKGEHVVLRLHRDPEPKIRWQLPTAPAKGAYVEPTPFIQSDSEKIRKRALDVVGNAETLQQVVERLSRFVFEHVQDEYVPAYSNALEALDSARGDCTEHSILFVALARALGIPARVAVGIAYWPPGGGFGWHAWAEVREGERWISVDPTWNQPVADVTHVKLADGGPAEQGRIVMLLGQLKLVNVVL